jgi:hypothetical protein
VQIEEEEESGSMGPMLLKFTWEKCYKSPNITVILLVILKF